MCKTDTLINGNRDGHYLEDVVFSPTFKSLEGLRCQTFKCHVAATWEKISEGKGT